MQTKKKKKDRKEGTKKLQKIKNGLQLLCNAGVYLFLFFLIAVYSFYAPEGYIQIATNKFLFFKKICLATVRIITPFILLYYIIPDDESARRSGEFRISATDWFMLAYAGLNLISYLGTEFREEALWGTAGWYMGFAMQLFFVGIYFFLSRFYDGKIDVLPAFMGITFLVFLWGLLNRFSIYPIDMQYHHNEFISSMGNINWFCGFWSVFFVTGVVLYLITEKMWLRIFSGIYCFIALGLGAVEGSDSAFLAMGVVFFFLLLISFEKTVYMKRWLELGMIYCAACQIMRIITKIFPKNLNMDSIPIRLMLGNLTLAVLLFLVAARIFLEKRDLKYQTRADGSIGKDSEKRQAQKEWIQEQKWLKYTVIGLTAGMFGIYLLLLAVNTRAPGCLGPLSRYSVFLFDGHWGSSRGATWRDGAAIYQSFSLRERLFGAGQDCFSIYAYNVPELSARLAQEWPTSRLTNAHNECITQLVNIGIFGLLSFIGIFLSSFKRLLQRAKKEPLCYVFAASLLSYFIHNQFSFAQVLSTPYIYMMLGLGENLMRRIDDRGILTITIPLS